MLRINGWFNSVRELHTILSEYRNELTLNTQESDKAELGKPRVIGNACEAETANISTISTVNAVNLDEVLNSLKKNGFALGIKLPQPILKEIQYFARFTPCYGNGNTNLGFYHADKEKAQVLHGNPFAFASYYNTALLCPAIKKLERDPLLLEIAAKYLQAEPIHQGNQLWWNFPVESSVYERRRAAQMFYSGLNNYRVLKFVFYITDVDLCSSPHVCVRGSHIKKKLSHLFLGRGYSYQQITNYYGYENIVPICGKAGFGFVEDSGCLHKETPPSSKERLTLQIEFAAKDYGMPNDLREVSQLKCIL